MSIAPLFLQIHDCQGKSSQGSPGLQTPGLSVICLPPQVASPPLPATLGLPAPSRFPVLSSAALRTLEATAIRGLPNLRASFRSRPDREEWSPSPTVGGSMARGVRSFPLQPWPSRSSLWFPDASSSPSLGSGPVSEPHLASKPMKAPSSPSPQPLPDCHVRQAEGQATGLPGPAVPPPPAPGTKVLFASDSAPKEIRVHDPSGMWFISQNRLCLGFQGTSLDAGGSSQMSPIPPNSRFPGQPTVGHADQLWMLSGRLRP